MASKLRADALAIWQAGVDAVRSDRLVKRNVQVEGRQLRIAGEEFALDRIRRIAVVGAGKAGAGMAAGLEAALGDELMSEKQLAGWVNVPDGCVRELRHITLHAARPASVNEPTEAGVHGARQILQLVASLEADDLCLCLLSGGGSALLPAPVDGVSLSDKQAVTRFLSGAGANIEQLNCVRRQLSQIKGGGLARACSAGRLVTLIISDVLGDPLETIASGPTVASSTTARSALDVLEQFHAREAGIAPSVFRFLEQQQQNPLERPVPVAAPRCGVTNVVIGNNAVAVDAAGQEAERRGYSHALTAAKTLEGPAEDVGRHLADMAVEMLKQTGPDCLITGGEPVVKLVPEAQRGLGGRNQQLVLAALRQLLSYDEIRRRGLENLALLSAGTDGEDGPTDAAGAVIDQPLFLSWKASGLDPDDFLTRNDAYHFFEPLGGLIKTGPTDTNVCDLRVVLVDRSTAQEAGRTVPGF